MRGTFTHANPDFLRDIETMLEPRFRQSSAWSLSSDRRTIPPALTDEDLPVVLEQYEKLAALMLERRRAGRPFTFYHYMLDLKGGPCIYKRISGCGSGTEYMAVTPWGDLYPCHQFVGEEKFRLGDIWNGVTNPETQARVRRMQRLRPARMRATAGQSSTVPAAAPPTRTMRRAVCAACMHTAARCFASVWNAQSCSRPQRRWTRRTHEHPHLRFCG